MRYLEVKLSPWLASDKLGSVKFFLILMICFGSASLSSGSCNVTMLEAKCSGTNMDTVPQDLNPQLQRLDISHNIIGYVSDMAGYPNLIDLKISHNLILDLGSNCFQNSHMMISMDISHNSLGRIEYSDFNGLRSLVTLDLSSNQIDYISRGAFSSLTHLQTLNLASNRLAVGEGFPQDLFTQANRQTLRYLDLSDNMFLSVPSSSLRNMEDLSDLDLSSNKLGKIDSREFDGIGRKLTSLKIKNCGLHTVGSNAFIGLDTLRELDMSNNYLNDVPNEAFRKLQSLEILYIGTNNFQHISKDDFGTLENLIELDMNGCHGNGIEIHPGAFQENSNLAILNITKCPGLRELDPSFSLQDLPNLRSVSLHGCGLSTIPHRLVDWTDIQHFDISNNPLYCDCMILFLAEILKEHLDWEEVTCAGPEDMEGVEVEDVDEKEMNCEEEGDAGLVLGLSLGMLSLLVLCVAMAVFIWKKKPWITSFRQNRRNRKRLSANYTGKDSIKVLQNLTLDTDKRFIPLPGLDSHNETETDYGFNSHLSLHGDNSLHSPIYAEVTETIPNYGIPLGTASFPDIKISEI